MKSLLKELELTLLGTFGNAPDQASGVTSVHALAILMPVQRHALIAGGLVVQCCAKCVISFQIYANTSNASYRSDCALFLLLVFLLFNSRLFQSTRLSIVVFEVRLFHWSLPSAP